MILSVVTIIFILSIFTGVAGATRSCRAVANPGSAYKGFSWPNCTYFAAVEFDKVAPSPKHNWRGNAINWYDNAKANGWRTTASPREAKKGAIVVWKVNTHSLGHVQIIRNITNSGIEVEGMNEPCDSCGRGSGTGGVHRYVIPWSNIDNKSYGGMILVGYILPERDVPACQVNTPNRPSGPSVGKVNTRYTFSASSSKCTAGHGVEYMFDFGERCSLFGSQRQTYTWSRRGTYNVRVQARCSQSKKVLSSWSASTRIVIQ